MKKFLKENKKTIIICLFLLSLVLFVNIKISNDPDYYWHIKAARYMLDNKVILTKDIFSWVPQIYNTYWMSHEWLFEILLGVFEKLFPNYHILIYSFVFMSILLLTLFFVNKKNWMNNILFTLIWFTGSIFFLVTYATARPQLIVFIFLVIALYLLYDLKKNENSKKIFLLPVLSLVWSNIHGGSSNIPYILVLIFIICGMFDFSRGKLEEKRLSKLQLKKYCLVCLLCIGAVVINPHGIKMLFYPYENMGNKFMLKTITEWHPTDFNDMYHILFYILFAVSLLIILLSKKKLTLTDLLLLGFTLFLGMKSIRFWMFFYISVTMVINKHIPKYALKEKDENYILLIVLIIIAMFISSFNDVNKSLKTKTLPDKFINYLKENKPKRLYNYYDCGGYLIYKDIPVFIDGRADLYSKYNYKDANYLSNMTGNFKKIMNKYNFDYYLILKNSGLSNYLKEKKEYEIVLSDKENILYKKVK